jgi:O-antigen ligase
MAVLYFGGAALSITLGRDWSKANAHQFGDFLFLALILAALGTSFLLLVQWLQLPWMGVWIQEVAPTHQPYGNLNQPNNAATLLVLGMVGMGWFAHRQRLSPNVWLFGCAFLSLFVSMTGSRIGYLSFAAVVIFALAIGWKSADFRPWRARLLTLLVVFVGGLLMANANLGVQTEIQTVASPRAFERDLATARLFIWQAYVTTAVSEPWSGFGFGQGFLTQIAAGDLGFDLRGLYTWTHNVLLDMATWFGLPAALVAISLVLWVLWRIVVAPRQLDRWIYTAGIFVVVLHGMVELPMAFAYFFFPVCLMTGAVLTSLRVPGIALARWVVVGWASGLSILFGAVVYDYLRVENAFYTWRFENARIGKDHPMDVPQTMVLNQFEAMLVGLRGTAETLTSNQVDAFDKAITHVPSLAALQHLAEIRMQQGDAPAAQRAADMAVLTATPHLRKALAARWHYLTLTNPKFSAVDWREEPNVARVRPE